MPEWILSTVDVNGSGLPLAELAVRLSSGFLLGCIVAGVYRLTCGQTGLRSSSLMATLVLLTILIGMVTLVIGNSVARAFSLVGALSIVRFRTVVEDTRDTAFVIFAVAVGMAAGAGYLAVALVGIPIVGLAAFLYRPHQMPVFSVSPKGTLSLRIGLGRDPEHLLQSALEKHLQSWRLTSTSTAKQGAVIALNYSVQLRDADTAVALVSELNSLEGVQDIDLRIN